MRIRALHAIRQRGSVTLIETTLVALLCGVTVYQAYDLLYPKGEQLSTDSMCAVKGTEFLNDGAIDSCLTEAVTVPE